ncbi:MAG TPA: N-acetyl-gamma-glutamyl-phosphate reductase [Deferrisomatales bacterium]|nr:N-acetyl-gamma-glutamyl-phosphate reductase [Deferrisomatales bacterium]
MHTIFIDGQQGTTGLQIHQRLAERADLEVLQIPPEQRKDQAVKRDYLNRADLVILCLPDPAAREAVALIENPAVRVIDASTAHRVADGWVFGLPELSPAQREAVRGARRVANPGCHATGFLCAAAPLVAVGVVPADYPFSVTSLTGYSGGGRQMIESYEAHDRDADGPLACRPYALGLRHKHLPEMQRHAGLAYPPLFEPCVGDFYAGMVVSVPLHTRLLPARVTPGEVAELLAGHFAGQPFVTVAPYASDRFPDDGFLSPTARNGSNGLDLFVFGHAEQILVCARFDNLGKGASGAAVQNLNLMLGKEETTGLT